MAAGHRVLPGGDYDAVASLGCIEGRLNRLGIVGRAISNGSKLGDVFPERLLLFGPLLCPKQQAAEARAGDDSRAALQGLAPGHGR